MHPCPVMVNVRCSLLAPIVARLDLKPNAGIPGSLMGTAL